VRERKVRERRVSESKTDIFLFRMSIFKEDFFPREKFLEILKFYPFHLNIYIKQFQHEL